MAKKLKFQRPGILLKDLFALPLQTKRVEFGEIIRSFSGPGGRSTSFDLALQHARKEPADPVRALLAHRPLAGVVADDAFLRPAFCPKVKI